MPKNVTPKVSVIVPNYNYEKFLGERIDSILSQTFQDFELIILDDCSTDNSKSVIEKYRSSPHVSHIIYNETNSGSPFVQWERGIKLAKGEWVWIAESDDVANENFLSTLIAEVEKNPDAVLAFSHSFLIDSEGKIFSKYWYDTNDDMIIVQDGKEFARKEMLWRNRIYNASMVIFRRSVFHNIPQTYVQYRAAGDWDFWMSVCLQGQVIEVRKSLNSFRRHTACVTENAGKTGSDWEEVAAILKSFIDQLQLNWLQKFHFRGQWTWDFRLSRYQNKEKLVKEYPEVFGGTSLEVVYAKLYKRIKKGL